MSHKVLSLAGCLGLVALAITAPASARDTRTAPVATPTPQTAQAPWYERFTFGSELRDGANAWVPRSETRTSAVVNSNSRWGVTFGVNQEPRAPLAPRTGQSTGRASAGAFYQVSPKFRVGGAVTIPEDQLNASERRDSKKAREPGVKVESAIRF